jgi:phospholipid transport system substrate-binding protein
MKYFLSFIALFVMLVSSIGAHATSQDPAFTFVKQTTDRGLSFLANPNLGEAQKRSEFRSLLNSSFDLDTIGRFALGKFWNTATPAERAEYMGLFRKMVVDTYSNRFSEYKGQVLEVLSSRKVGNDYLVASVMRQPKGGGTDVKIDWRVRNKGAGFKIVDVIVEGVSMSVTQRSDFASVIQGSGGKVSTLIDSLKKNDVASR